MGKSKADGIGARIKAQREAYSLTQGELAKQLFVKRETINQWESETRQIKDGHIARLADVLNTSCDYLLGRTDTPTTDADERACCDYTGLSKEAVDWLHKRKNADDKFVIGAINSIIMALCSHTK